MDIIERRYFCVTGAQVLVFGLMLASVIMLMTGILIPKYAYVFLSIGFGLILVNLGFLILFRKRISATTKPIEVTTYGSV